MLLLHRRTAVLRRAALAWLALLLAACGDDLATSPSPLMERVFDVTGAYGAPRYDASEIGLPGLENAALPAYFACPQPASYPDARAAAVFTSGTLRLAGDGTFEWRRVSGTWYRTDDKGGLSGSSTGEATTTGRWHETSTGRVVLTAGASSQLFQYTELGSGEMGIALPCPGFSMDTLPRAVILSFQRR